MHRENCMIAYSCTILKGRTWSVRLSDGFGCEMGMTYKFDIRGGKHCDRRTDGLVLR